jgi:hypothetical protein
MQCRFQSAAASTLTSNTRAQEPWSTLPIIASTILEAIAKKNKNANYYRMAIWMIAIDAQ